MGAGTQLLLKLEEEPGWTRRVMDLLCCGGDRAEKHRDIWSFLPSPNLRLAEATPVYISHRVVFLGCFSTLACNKLVDSSVMQLNYCLNPPKEEANRF